MVFSMFYSTAFTSKLDKIIFSVGSKMHLISLHIAILSFILLHIISLNTHRAEALGLQQKKKNDKNIMGLLKATMVGQVISIK